MKRIYLLPVLFFGLLCIAFVTNTRIITGTITDNQGNGIGHVSVTIKGNNKSIIADASGKYKIQAKDNDVLVFSAVGYIAQEIKVGRQTIINVVLIPANNVLNEIVVVGYGTRHTKTIIGACSSIQNDYSLASSPSVYLRGKSGGLMKPELDGRSRDRDYNREGYDNIKENQFLKTTDHPLSTFSIDVDGASYSNVRRMINSGQMPPSGAVRIEEMVNYFSYNYPPPTADAPFSINTEYAFCPWNDKHQLIAIGLQGKKIATEKLPPANLVFLIDVSGSMNAPDKLPLVHSSINMLVEQLRPQDKVAIVVYAGSAGLVLPSTEGSQKHKIKEAIDQLQAGGSTAGGAGIALAYKVAQDNFIKNGNNRVILCTDGDFNVGASSDDALERMIEQKRESGIFLTVLGYGTGNYQDAKMQKLANKGNGNHAYIDNAAEAKRVLISQFGGTLFTIAKDVKLQIEFNPAIVQGYRLIGYENRLLAKEDFNDDKKDAGELGSGHTVTALYEIIPVGIASPELKRVDDLKYQKTKLSKEDFKSSNDVMTVKFRYKKPDGNKSLLLEHVVNGLPESFANASNNLHLAAAVAQFGMLLRDSEYKGAGNYKLVTTLLSYIPIEDKEGSITELLQLVKAASALRQKETLDKDGSDKF